MVVLPTLALATLAAFAALDRTQDPGAVVQGPFAERIDRYLTAAAELGLAGTLLVEKDGEVILHKGYGVVDREGTAGIHGVHLGHPFQICVRISPK